MKRIKIKRGTAFIAEQPEDKVPVTAETSGSEIQRLFLFREDIRPYVEIQYSSSNDQYATVVTTAFCMEDGTIGEDGSIGARVYFPVGAELSEADMRDINNASRIAPALEVRERGYLQGQELGYSWHGHRWNRTETGRVSGEIPTDDFQRQAITALSVDLARDIDRSFVQIMHEQPIQLGRSFFSDMYTDVERQVVHRLLYGGNELYAIGDGCVSINDTRAAQDTKKQNPWNLIMKAVSRVQLTKQDKKLLQENKAPFYRKGRWER